MKLQEIILDIIGIGLILLSAYAFLNGIVEFKEATIIGLCGLALFVLKGSSIRKMVVSFINKFTK